MTPEYAIFVCPTCRDDPGEECGDDCLSGAEWIGYLPDLGEELPDCPCCLRPGETLTPLVPIAG